MITRRAKVKALQTGVLAALLTLVLSSASQAGPLGVAVVSYPDIATGFLTTTYNATTGAFTSNGWALSLDTGPTGTKTNITTNFTLQATINNDGTFGGGTLNVGTVAAPLLKSVNLIDFKYEQGVKGGLVEFLFGSPTGSYTTGLTPTYSPNLPLDVLLSVGTGFNGSFASSWSSSAGTGDIREDPVDGTPEPSALLLTLLGAIGGLGFFSRRGTAAVSPQHC